MGKGNVSSYYKKLSVEDQRTFDRWLKANAILGSIFAVIIIAMALMGSRSVGPGDAAVTSSATSASDVASSQQRRNQADVMATQGHVIRQKAFRQ